MPHYKYDEELWKNGDNCIRIGVINANMPKDRNAQYISMYLQGNRTVDVGQHCRGGDCGRQAQRSAAQGRLFSKF